MRITITCEECGRRHRLERTVDEAGPIWIVCHECELPLRAVLETTSAAATAPVLEPVTTSQSFVDAWTGTLDLSTSTSA
ncbi:MAG TPA: hypothetical protein VH134_13145 [Candidatus Dormibacteraeota bacterium]|jgi:hypothetical protein|nr:hypothetical protein [Candidatus Dormibacteraeota bacterium]